MILQVRKLTSGSKCLKASVSSSPTEASNTARSRPIRSAPLTGLAAAIVGSLWGRGTITCPFLRLPHVAREQTPTISLKPNLITHNVSDESKVDSETRKLAGIGCVQWQRNSSCRLYLYPKFHQQAGCWGEISCVRGRSVCNCLRIALPANHADSIHCLIDPELAVITLRV